jgi:glycosyltransferase-like protein
MISVGLYTYSTAPRGSVVHTAYLAEALAELGLDVTVYALDKGGAGFFRPLRVPLRLVRAAPAPSSTAALVAQRAGELAAYVAERAPPHDVYHAQDCLTANGLLAARASRPTTLVRTVHHLEQFQDPVLAECQERSILAADLCLTVSEATRRELDARFDLDAALVGNGVDVERFARVSPARTQAWRARLGAAAGPAVLAVGGVEPRKNSVRVLRAFARLRQRHPGAQLWILGGATVLDHGAYRSTFADALADLPADARAAVRELGVVADDDVPALFHAADVLAMPSLHEGFGLAALEALAAGLPLVASDRPPFTEFLDGGCATLVDPLSEQAIAAGLLRALTPTPSRRDQGLRRARECSWRRVAERHAELYERTCARAGDALRRSLA